MKDKILGIIEDSVADFVYYDRKNDEDLSIEQLNNAVKNGEVTIDEMVETFRNKLEATFKQRSIPKGLWVTPNDLLKYKSELIEKAKDGLLSIQGLNINGVEYVNSNTVEKMLHEL